LKLWQKEHKNDISSIPFLLLAQVTLFLLPMQVVIHAWGSFWLTLPVFLLAAAGVYHFWWKNLPSAENPGVDRGFGDSADPTVSLK
jgi:solute:Na+ symporter, SSS family